MENRVIGKYELEGFRFFWLQSAVDFETEFEQNIPLAVATLVGGGGLALAGLAAAVEE